MSRGAPTLWRRPLAGVFALFCALSDARAEQVPFEAFTGGPPLAPEEVDAVGPWRIAVFRSGADVPAACSAAAQGLADPPAASIGPPTLLLTVWTDAPETPELMVAYELSATPQAPAALLLEAGGAQWDFFHDDRRDAWWPNTDELDPILTAFDVGEVATLRSWDQDGAAFPPARLDVGDARAALARAAAACRPAQE